MAYNGFGGTNYHGLGRILGLAVLIQSGAKWARCNWVQPMPKKISVRLLCVLSVTASCAAHAAPPGPAFPHFESPKALEASCDRGLKTAAAELKKIQKRSVDKRWLVTYDAFSARLEDLSGPLLFLSAVHPEKAMRNASEACELRWNDFNSSLGQNELLYAALNRLKPADDIDAELLRATRDTFVDSGVALPPTARKRAKQLSDEINELGQAFDRNIRDANVRLAFTEADLRGVPPAVWKDAPRDPEGRYLLGLAYPIYVPLMQSAENPATRERMWLGKTNEGGEANLKLLDQITRKRKEYAGLFDVPSWDAFVLRRRMAETPERALAFLADVKSAVEKREVDELEQLRAAKAGHLGQPLAGVKLDRWDISFYTERVRQQRYAVDQEAFRAYFPPEQSLQFALRVIERMMGVRYQRIAGAKAWHPDVHTYAVSDASSGRPLATLWVDLYPREGKYNHAAVWGLRASSTALMRSSQAALVVNFDRKGLTLDELETLLHELGHAVHNNLSATRYSLQAGTSVKRDFVEAPSQMLEDWAYDKNVLKVFAEVCPECKPVPDDLIAKADVARRFGKGIFYSRQHLYASYDLGLYGPEPRDPMALWSRMEGETPLGHVQGTMFPAGFSHIAGGYSAGYYGYLWSQVVALDLRTAFERDKLNSRVGGDYRRKVLANGSQRPPAELVRDFLGRDFNAQAFYEDLKR